MEVALRLGLNLAVCEIGRFLRNHQGGGIERDLHGGACRVGSAVIDGRRNGAEYWNQGDRKDNRNVAGAIRAQSLSIARGSVNRPASGAGAITDKRNKCRHWPQSPV